MASSSARSAPEATVFVLVETTARLMLATISTKAPAACSVRCLSQSWVRSGPRSVDRVDPASVRTPARARPSDAKRGMDWSMRVWARVSLSHSASRRAAWTAMLWAWACSALASSWA